MRLLLSITFAATTALALAQQPSAAPAPASSTEMKQIFEEDQSIRLPQSLAKLDRSHITRDDSARRSATKQLLDSGSLHTGNDFFWAAIVFQHGDKPDDYLLAHTLSLIAVAKGQPNGLWIATATLDRYLQKIGHPQVYGTQFSRANTEGKWTQEPYNRDLISDTLRKELGVAPLVEQQNQLERFQTGSVLK